MYADQNRRPRKQRSSSHQRAQVPPSNQAMNNRPNSQQPQKASAPTWVVWAVAILALSVILLGVGITSMVIWIERDRDTVAEVGLNSAESSNPPIAAIISPTPTDQPIPTPTLALPTEAPVATATQIPVVITTTESIIVGREDLTDLKSDTTTEPPVATATVPPPGSVTAPRVDSPFVIDADLTGWTNIPSYVSTFTVYNQPWWDGTNDLDAFWRMAWDSVNLYISVVIVDDTHVQTQQPITAYRGDSVEIQIDTDRLGDLTQRVNQDDFQIIMSPGNFGAILPGAYRFRGTGDNRMVGAPGHSITVSSVKTDTGYVLEAVIPWSDLELRPVDNLVLGIALSANDNDVPDSAVQVLMKSHVDTRTFDMPESWGTLILTNN